MNPVQILWANHINQATFDSICKLNGLISLYIQSNRITDISAISQLTSLKHLALISMTKLEEITSLSKLARLKTLKIENFKKISDFSCLSDLVNLEGLEIDGDMYTAQKINDFGFLKEMTKLKYLTFINSRAKIKDFTPLMNLQNL